ncbi:NADH dehydrogenase subunit H [Balnearium lithotrophicum]|uniref:NADH-quinone oxidoreductase subunit H n=1 Tax=Balnearium lithotrophicum TaxID=223788 RepID=A0A521AH12_9BACT|nr:NADH-quinone oxidoreductase subunit NuoH [Balnearium lithotrophicum]SMO34028.1 NADH dehydrogenase subunit H [Balnearium lithotrophicum]
MIENFLSLTFVVVLMLVAVPPITYLERKVLGHMQQRPGPMVVGFHGLLQPLADAIKLIFKEDIIPRGTDRFLFMFAPSFSIFAALLAASVVPIGFIQAVPMKSSLLFVVAMSAVSIYALILAGYSSNDKYSFLAGMRAAAQVLGYELPLGFALMAVVILFGSFDFKEIVNWQLKHGWGILYQPIAFLIFLFTMVAEIGRPPFDLPEGESELVGGFHTEYSGMRFAAFFFGEYINIIVLSLVVTLLFFGGWSGPLADKYPLLGVVYHLLKAGFFIFLTFWLRATFPRYRFDQMLSIMWKVLLPVSIINLFVAAVEALIVG